VVVLVDALLGSDSMELQLEREMFLQTSSNNMTGNFQSVEELIAACKRQHSLLYWTINHLEKDYHKGLYENDTVEQLEEIFETLDALASVVK
jgi:hypothetical protein